MLRFWVAARCIEGTFRLHGSDTLGNPVGDDGLASVTGVLDHQLAAIMVKFVLEPLRYRILDQLKKLMEEKKKENWFKVFLSSFILLNHFELLMSQQQARAIELRSKVRGSTDTPQRCSLTCEVSIRQYGPFPRNPVCLEGHPRSFSLSL